MVAGFAKSKKASVVLRGSLGKTEPVNHICICVYISLSLLYPGRAVYWPVTVSRRHDRKGMENGKN